MRVVHVTQSDLRGGAARAATRLHTSLQRAGVDSWMVVNERLGTDLRTRQHSRSLAARLARLVASPALTALRRYSIRQHGGYSSVDLVRSGLIRAAFSLAPDIVHLHWLGAEAVSIEEIGSIGTPVVWTLHDMWPLCGALHYDRQQEQAVWRTGVASWAAAFRDRALAVERINWLRKQRSWQGLDAHLVGPSRWASQCAAQSRLFGARPIQTIPNALDTDVFRPRERSRARRGFDLPSDRPIILFGAIGGLHDPRKGGGLLSESLRKLPRTILDQRPILCVFGQQKPVPVHGFDLELRTFPRIDDDQRLAMLYSACDVMVVPSAQETLGQTGTEAQACGCPVVTGDTSGTADLVEHKASGFLCEGRSSDQIAAGIAWVLEDNTRRTHLRHHARKRACALWSYPVVSKQYTALYSALHSPERAQSGTCDV